VLRELGVELRITKLKIKPGKPFVFGMATRQRGFVAGSGPEAGGGARRGLHTTYVFGLPGNPVSSYVCTLVLAARLLARLSGGTAADADARFMELPLAKPLEANGPRQFYQPARLVAGKVQPLQWRGSADAFTLAEADGLVERPADDPAREPGHFARFIGLP
jgi:molybdopterin molybdotransferase